MANCIYLLLKILEWPTSSQIGTIAKQFCNVIHLHKYIRISVIVKVDYAQEKRGNPVCEITCMVHSCRHNDL